MRAMSTPVGHSRLQPLHETQRSSASFTASLVNASVPSWPESASLSVFARPRVTCCSSRVARKLGHIVPASNLRQWPLLLHISTALAKPPVESPPVPGALIASVRGSFCTSHADQSSTGTSAIVRYGAGACGGGKRNSAPSSIFGGSTILPGLNRPFGSSTSLIERNASLMSGPNCHSIHSPRHRPSPCSPLNAPL